MGYIKLSFKQFITAVHLGKYRTATGARRAVGKVVLMTDKERAIAQQTINKHFKVAAKPVPLHPRQIESPGLAVADIIVSYFQLPCASRQALQQLLKKGGDRTCTDLHALLVTSEKHLRKK